jgi:hypothetical protein
VTIGTVTSRGAPALIDPAEMISTSGGTLAAIFLDSQAAQRDADHDQLQTARAEYQDALADEVAAMHEAADRILMGAVVQGSLAVVAGYASVSGALESRSLVNQALATHDDRLLEAALKQSSGEVFGSALSQLSAPVGQLVSGGGGQHALADAKAASGRAEEGREQVEDAQKNINESNDASKNATDWAASLVNKNDQTVSALIGNIA